MSESEQRIAQGVVELLAKKGLVVVTAEMADAALQHKKAVDRLMRRNSVTAYEASKFKLIGKTSLKTIKNMCADGRITEHEHYLDAAGTLRITTKAIKRLRDE